MSNMFLLNISITPVQEFIAEARKTRDLWIGSYLLSFITFKALEPFINNKNCEIIYPAFEKSPFCKRKTNHDSDVELQVASLPNHFLVIVPENDLETLVNESKRTYEKFWNDNTQKVKNHIKNQFSKIDNDWDFLWDDQIKDHWQYMWVATPIGEEEITNNYLKKVQEIQRFLEERKLTRTFSQWKGSLAIKCNQCGHREVLGPKQLVKNSAFWNSVHANNKAKIRKGDRLCSICLIKRFLRSSDILDFLKEPDFISTLDIAVIPFKNKLQEKLNQDQKYSLIKAANELWKAIGFDELLSEIHQISGDLLYIDEITPEKLVKEYFPELKDKEISDKKRELEHLSNNLKTLLKQISKEHNAKPSKYYAVLFMDGDNIGKWLSGALPAGSDSFTIEKHRDLSKKLGELGVKVMPREARLFSARPVYSGGDDLLVLSPLDSILILTSKLREKYSSEGINSKATTSAGIIIAHYSEPFKRVLEEGRRTIEKAKEKGEKDAFQITLILSSGTYIEGGYKWYMQLHTSIIDDVLLKLAEWISDRKLSARFIYDVFGCLDVFYDDNNKLNEGMFRAEIERLFLRHFDNKILKEEMNNEIRDFINNLSTIANPSNYSKEMNAYDNTRDLLRISNFIARESLRWE